MPKIEVQVGAETDVGMVRDHNEDNLGYRMPEDEALVEEKGMLFLVADGMGGHAAGEVASQIAVDTILDRYFQEPDADIQESLHRAFIDANEIIHSQATNRREQSGMGTTAVVAIIKGDLLVVANVGDSRAYLIRDDTITQVTEDHSWVQEQVRLNLITPEEAKHHPLRNIITRALGTSAEVKPDFHDYRLKAGDILILCSDGLSGVVTDEDILRIVKTHPNAEMAAKMLINAANAGGGPDNISTIVVRIDKIEEGVEQVYEASPRRSQYSTTVKVPVMHPAATPAVVQETAAPVAPAVAAPAAPTPAPAPLPESTPKTSGRSLLQAVLFVIVATATAAVTALVVLLLYLLLIPASSG